MSNYSKTVNFAVKDALLTGDPAKVVKGAEINTEYDNIATMSATKTDNSAAAITGGSINGTTIGNSSAAAGTFTSVVSPIVDSGSTGALSLKTNNGQLGFEVVNSGTSGVNWQSVPSSSTPILQVSGSDKTGVIASSGTGSLFLATGAGARNVLQILDTAASTRFIKIAASTTNPTIDVSAGSLAITPNIVAAGTITHGGTIATGSAQLIVTANGFTAFQAAGVGGNNAITVTSSATNATLSSSGGTAIILGSGSIFIQFAQALIALGGGAVPTVGTIGGTGPATAAQNTWMKFLDSTGNQFFVPVWK